MISANYKLYIHAMTHLWLCNTLLSHLGDIPYATLWCGILMSNERFLPNGFSLSTPAVYHGWAELVTQRGEASSRGNK